MKSAVEPIAVMLLRRGHTLDKYALAAEAKCHQRTAQRVLRGMHQLKMCYVTDWETIYTRHIPSYAAMPGEDKKRPPAVAAKVRIKKHRKRNPELRMQEAYAKRMKRQGNGVKHQPEVV